MEIGTLVERRARDIRRRHPDMSVDFITQEGDFGKWGIILYTEYDFSVMGFDFIESETSWKRPEAVEEYNGLVEDGYCVVVYVPDRVKIEVARMLKEKGGKSNIRLYSEEKAIVP